jgi:SAM-dependent methyltransferase
MSEYDTIIASHYSAYRPPLHAPLLQSVLGDARFGTGLDVGCGTGQSSVALTSFCEQVYGLEPSTAMLERAVTHPSVTYQHRMQELNKKVELLCFFGSLHYISEEELQQYLRALSAGGTILCLDFEVDYTDILAALGVILPPGDYDHQKNLDSYGLSGFENIAQETMKLSFTCNPEALGHLLLSAGVFQDAFATVFQQPDPYGPLVEKLYKILPGEIELAATGYFSRYSG